MRSIDGAVRGNGTNKTRDLEQFMSLLDPGLSELVAATWPGPSWLFGWECLAFEPEQDRPPLALVVRGSRESSPGVGLSFGVFGIENRMVVVSSSCGRDRSRGSGW